MKRRIAIIGLGYFSQFHLGSWTRFSESEVVAALDVDPLRCAWARTTYDVPVVDNILALLQAEPDIVDIVAPPQAHKQLVRAVLKTGRVVICQKPFCTSPQEAREVVDIAERAGMTLLIHENFRFQPWHRTIKTFLATGKLGDVFQAQFFLRPGDGRGPNAYLDRQPAFQRMPRFLIHETGVHFIDLFRHFFGDVREVYAETRKLNPSIAGEDSAMMLLTHASGVRTVMDGNRLADHKTDNLRRTMGEMQIEGTEGTLRMFGSGEIVFREFGTGQWWPVPLEHPVDDTTFGGGCVAALNGHVLDVLKGNGVHQNLARDYLHVLDVSEAAYQSAQSGQKLSIPAK